MVAKCFSKYDCTNFDGNKTEDNIYDGVGDAMVENPIGRRGPQWRTTKVAIWKRKK